MKKFYAILLMLFSPGAFAAANVFTIPPQDISMQLLNKIFGTIGTILTGPVSQSVVTQVLKYFNNACLVLGGILILYSLIVSTVNTAHDGEMLGKKWNSVWIPVRAAFGFGLLLPTKATLVFIQVFVLWVIIQGVGAADYIWKNTVSQPQNYQPVVLNNSADVVSVGIAASIVLVNQVCQSTVAALASTQNEPVKPQVYDGNNQFEFGVSNSNSRSVCGTLSYTSGSKADVEQLISNMQNGATKQFLNYYGDINNPNPLNQSQVQSVQAGIRNATSAYVSAEKNRNTQNLLNSGAYGPVGNSTSPQAMIQNTINSGWFSAGGYYISISQLSQHQQSVSISVPSAGAPTSSQVVSIVGASSAGVVSNASQAALSASCMGTPSAECSPFTTTGTAVSLKIKTPGGLKTILMSLINPAYMCIQGITMGFVSILNGFTTASMGFNPIIGIMQWGTSMLHSLSLTFTTMLTVIFAIGAVAYTCSCANPIGYAIGSGLTWIVPFVFMMFMAIWMFGSLTAYYVPLIPYILFTLGGIAWLIAVIEAMVAAPLMALGILHPEGRHDIFGHASAGIMILANVFLRPSLMIVGFWAGYIMLGVATWIVNGGFYQVVVSMTGGSISAYGALSVMGIYILLMLIVINKSFSLIYVIPDRIFRWIGGPTEDTGIAQDLAQIKQGYEQQAQKFTGAGKESMAAQEQLSRQKAGGTDSEKKQGTTGGGG